MHLLRPLLASYIIIIIIFSKHYRGGGGARKTVWTPSSNVVELKEDYESAFKIIGRKRKKIQGVKKGGVGGTTLRPLYFHVFLYLFCFVSDLRGSSIDIFLPAKELHCDFTHNL